MDLLQLQPDVCTSSNGVAVDVQGLLQPDVCTSSGVRNGRYVDINNDNNKAVPVPKGLCESIYQELEAIVSELVGNGAVREHLERRVWNGVRERYGRLPSYKKMYKNICYKLNRFLDLSSLAEKNT